MRIVIVGLGQTGTMLADLTAKERHDVIVVDQNKEIVDKTTDYYSVGGICGNGATKETLLKAGADTADVVVAVTPVDEINMLICRVAKSCGCLYTAARIHRTDISKEEQFFKKEFQIDYFINSAEEMATEIARHIHLPGTIKADAFFGNDACMVRVKVQPKSELVGMGAFQMRNFFGADVLTGCVVRGDKFLVPDSKFLFQPDDVADFIIPTEAIEKVMVKLGLLRKAVKKVLIVGGGVTGLCLAEKLIQEKKTVSIIENNPERCRYLAEKVPQAFVSFADGMDTENLLREKMTHQDAVITLTGKDENNLVISLFAWSNDVGTIITKVNSTMYEKLLNKVSIDITISPSVITTERLFSFIKNVAVYNEKGNDIQSLYQVADGKAEVLEFIVYDNFMKSNVPFKSKEFTVKKDVMIAAIIRDGEFIIPNGESVIKPDDRVIVVAKVNNGINSINQIFKS